MDSELESEYYNFNAFLNGDRVTIETFLKNTKNKTCALSLLVERNRPELISLLEIDINTICHTSNYRTCLWDVRTIETLQFLVQQNINVYHRDKYKHSILYYLIDDYELFPLQFERMFEYLCSFKIEKDWNSLILYFIYKKDYGSLYVLLKNIARRSDFSIKEIDNIVIDEYFHMSSFCWLTLIGRNWDINFGEICFIENRFMTVCLLECLGKIIDDDICSIVSNKFDDTIKNKLLIQNDNVVKFKSHGTNFFTLPYHQIIDALTMLLYAGYKETHPLYEKFDITDGFMFGTKPDGFPEDDEFIPMHIDKIKAKLKAVFILSNYSQIAKEIAQTDFEEAQESISKRIKRT